MPNPHRLSEQVSYCAIYWNELTFPLFPGSLPAEIRNAVPKRQREFLAGRYCAAVALKGLGSTTAEVAISPDRAPVWPEGTVGSITHSGNFAAAAAARNTGVIGLGIDSERIVSHSAAEDVAKLCMVDEMRLFAGGCGRSFCEFCTVIFSAKEAVFKCLFPITRKFLEFSHIMITSIDWHSERFVWETAVFINDAFPAGYRGSGRFSCLNGFVHSSVELPLVPE